MYQCLKSSSAAVKFENHDQFNGIIDSRFVINNEISVRKSSKFFQIENKQKNSDLLDLLSMSVSNEKIKIPKSHGHKAKTAYIETLVLVNYDLVKELQTESDKFAPVVSYILTLFNIVDMLYSKIEEPKIKFNIAGIIIGTGRESFSRLAKNCFDEVDRDGNVEEELDVNCANSFIATFCGEHRSVISQGSYDIAVFLTR
ncbi:hypothetical protein PV327_005198 [Microctonus hyperodae]|uniref:Uncharacterized protein n=1 Tax=Microctonus hyperodae TaxID=165561 RepID=A0AA39G1M1_MICHY|nr:hypothetical protein PV327_005198 [Microctonus hyperodae]